MRNTHRAPAEAGSENCSAPGCRGCPAVLIMGDGSRQFFAAVNPQLKKLDNGAGEYIAQVIGSTGYSRGEDKLMGPREWKADAQAAKGGLKCRERIPTSSSSSVRTISSNSWVQSIFVA